MEQENEIGKVCEKNSERWAITKRKKSELECVGNKERVSKRREVRK